MSFHLTVPVRLPRRHRQRLHNMVTPAHLTEDTRTSVSTTQHRVCTVACIYECLCVCMSTNRVSLARPTTPANPVASRSTAAAPVHVASTSGPVSPISRCEQCTTRTLHASCMHTNTHGRKTWTPQHRLQRSCRVRRRCRIPSAAPCSVRP